MAGFYIDGLDMPGYDEFVHIRVYGDGDVTVELSDGTEEVVAQAICVHDAETAYAYMY